jgi:hypothetical protein
VLTSTGLCPRLLEMVRVRALTLSPEERFVSIALDGMTLTKRLTYKKHSDSVAGFVDCGKLSQNTQVADQGVMIVIRGLTLRWTCS